MADYQRTVDDVRALVQSGDQTLSDSLRSLATQFADLSRQTDERLQRCEDYLQKGLRSEAIQLASVEPPLLEVLAALEFPERTQWEELTTMYGLPSARRVNVERAKALNSAYAEQDPLETLLRQHRRLALARAPLAQRLRAMRELAKIDVFNPVWISDIQSFEQVRVQQLEVEFQQAARTENAEAAQDVLREIESNSWRAEMPTPLLSAVRAMVSSCWQRHLRQSLPDIVAHMHQCMKEGDVATAQQVRTQWFTAIESINLSAQDPLAVKADPVLNWLSDQEFRQAAEEDYQRDISALEEALLRPDINANGLEALYFQLQRHQLSLPKFLKQRYQQRLESLTHARNWWEKLILISISVVGMILIMGFIGWLLLRKAKPPKVPPALPRTEWHPGRAHWGEICHV